MSIVDTASVLDAFRAAMREAGLDTEAELAADGRIHRIHVNGDRRGSRHGWYVIHLDGRPAGAFGSWRTGVRTNWSLEGSRSLTREERAALRREIREQRARRMAEERRKHEEAAQEAARIWAAATPATDHAYLKKKGVKPHGTRIGTWRGRRDTLMVPILVDGQIVSIQAILAEPLEDGRTKDFLVGGRKKGGYFPIGRKPTADETIVIAEGFATGATIHEATGLTVFVAFDAGNLEPVARTLRARFPAVRILIAADNDQWTAGNPGLTQARRAAEAVGGLVVVPDFPANDPGRPSDFNDLAAREGLEAVRRAFLEPPEPGSFDGPPLDGAGPDANDRPVIRVAGGLLSFLATQGEAAIVQAGMPIYRRGAMLVRPVVEEVDAAHGRRTKVARLARVDVAYLRDRLAQAAKWQKFDARKRDLVEIDPPTDVAATILARDGEWTFPPVVGVLTTPTLRPNGTVLDQEGYDAETRLILVAPPRMPAVPTEPSREDARRALALLDSLLAEFPFKDEASRAVALSALITPVVRAAFPTTPLHVIRSHAPGSGKSYLCDLAAAIVIGQPCPVMAAGRTEEETEKRLSSALLAGQPLISLDNVNGDLGGDALCQFIERPQVEVRILGRSELVRIEARATTIFSTGNNLRILGDLTRRVLLCTLDPALERPELRQFVGNPVHDVLADRGRYIAAALTIVRAYLAAGSPDRAPRLASFGEWSDTVRSALIWLGCADPVATMETARDEDPQLALLKAVVVAWAEELGTGRAACRAAGEVLRLVEERVVTVPSDSQEPSWRYPALREAVLDVATNRGRPDARTFGRWLSRNKGRITVGLRLEGETDPHGHPARWWVEEVR